MNPPCEINIIVVKTPFKIESHMLTIKIKENVRNKSRNLFSKGVQRPKDSIVFDDSNSNPIADSSYVPI
jgi:hypothetical protein